ncbi:MAG: flavin-containing monooxygenase [Actinomycetota bacterium]
MTTTPLPDADHPDALREKYRIEREKRLRPEANAQYHDLTGRFADFDTDPYVEPGFTRDPEVAEIDVVIVGAGFGGMLAAANLRKLGDTTFRIIDKAGDFGGTWYWNRYPGCMCDVESYVYMPMLEETGYMPTEKYASAPEIFRYCQLLGRTFDLYDSARFQTEIRTAEWDAGVQRWVVTTTRDDRLTARFLVIAGGVLNHAKLPGIPGIENFAGAQFHTSRWDYRLTGGGPFERMEHLADKRVGIVGTGATAVQVVPRLAESAQEVYVFQRTPAAVGVRNQKPTDPEWFASLEPGWQRERIRNFTANVTGAHPGVDLVDDEWTKLWAVDTRVLPTSPEEAEELERIDFEKMDALRRRIDEIIEDPLTAEKLKPWYGAYCKRPCFHDDYLPAFNRPNVHLVDTDGRGVERITERGPVVDGVEYTRHPHLRVRLRGDDRLQPPPRLRPGGPPRPVDERGVGRRCPHVARGVHAGLPEPPDDQHRAGRLRRELRPLPHRDGAARGDRDHDLPRGGRGRDRGDGGGPGRVVRAPAVEGRGPGPVQRQLHPGLPEQRAGPGRHEGRAQHAVHGQCDGVRRHPCRLAR